MTNWNLKILWIISILLFCSCNTELSKEKKRSLIISNTNSIDQNDSTKSNLIEEDVIQSEIKKPTQKYFYPNMSLCGGALYGIYKGNELVRIESTYGAEMGYSSKNVDFENGEVIRINYHEHHAEWGKYSEKYPNDDEIDPNKMTYSDTLYVLEFGEKKSFKKYSEKKLIASSINTELIDRLLKCVETMKTELACEKHLVKD